MGWRDINLNRRKPKIDVAVVPVAPGEDRVSAVLRKAAAQALAAAAAGADAAFTAGYVAGYARHKALRHGVDAEQDMAPLLAQLAAGAEEDVRAVLATLSFAPRRTASHRAALAANDAVADAGYLVGHLEALCGTTRLNRPEGGAEAYLTRCDHVADRLQTHQPTAVLRLDETERAVVQAALTNA